jgi:phage terminase large subunit GpA-like protein
MSVTAWGDKFVAKAKPKSRLSGTEWADRYRYVAPGTSPEPGQWKTSRVPYLAEPMNCATDRGTETTVMMCSSQVGKSEFLLNIMGYYADQEPAPQLMLQPTVENAEAFSKERIDPTFRYSSGLKDKLEEGKEGRGTSRKASTTIRMKHYAGGYLALVGANSPAGLASRPIRCLLADEVDRYGYTKEGDPLKLAIQRTTNFHNRKICLVSTPTIADHSKIEEWWKKSDQRYYHVPCPHCGVMQVLKWSQVKYRKNSSGALIPRSVYYECEHCQGKIKDSHKHDMLQAGRWVAEKPEVKKIAGFHINSIYSPWVKFSALVEEWIEVHKNRDRKGLMEFINLKLGEPWREKEDDLDHEFLHKNRREYYGADLPKGALLLTCGIDFQPDRAELETVAWGLGRESWGIEYKVFMGSPAMPSLWQQIDEYLQRQWQFEDGSALGIASAMLDSGDGNYTDHIYQFTKPRENRRIFSGKGRGGAGIPFISKPARNNRIKAALFTIGVDSGKADIMARVRIEEEGPGYCHWPREQEKGYDLNYFKGLLSEKLVFKYINGQTKAKWEKITDSIRNEPLDCRNYATAAMEVLNPNFEALAKYEQKGNVYIKGNSAAKPRKRRQISKGVT